MVSSLLDVADWEEYITHEGWMGTLQVVNNHYDTFLEPLVKHFADVNVAGQALCYRSLLAVYEDLARAPESLALEDLDADCGAPLTRSETTALLGCSWTRWRGSSVRTTSPAPQGTAASSTRPLSFTTQQRSFPSACCRAYSVTVATLSS